MKTNQVLLHYTEYKAGEALLEGDALLVSAALNARENAYAPYSNYKVGAALLLSDGTIVVGNNQENAAYPSGLCAERVALFAARAQYPKQAILALAVVTSGEPDDSPASPCGSCRQVMAEFEQLQGKAMRLIMANTSKAAVVFDRASDLLPFCFTCEQLGKDVK
jgi:cytidine deaminase